MQGSKRDLQRQTQTVVLLVGCGQTKHRYWNIGQKKFIKYYTRQTQLISFKILTKLLLAFPKTCVIFSASKRNIRKRKGIPMQGYRGKKYIGKYANGQRIADEMLKREKVFVASLSKTQKLLRNKMNAALAAYNEAVVTYSGANYNADTLRLYHNAYESAKTAFESSLQER